MRCSPPMSSDDCEVLSPTSADAAKDVQIRRTVVVHYHIFKNAGTSVDELLRANFGARWVAREFPYSAKRHSNSDLVAKFLEHHSEVVAMSSHTARPPLPQLAGATVFPVLFLRHPIDRLGSVYAFQRRRCDMPATSLAKQEDFAGYLRNQLSRPRQARNLQTFILAGFAPLEIENERERALWALENLPFIGLVEAYEASISQLVSLLRKQFPRFRIVRARRNVAPSRPRTLDQRLARIRHQLGADLYTEICLANEVDLEIFAIIRKRYPTTPRGLFSSLAP